MTSTPWPKLAFAQRSDPGREPAKQVNEDAAHYQETPLGHLLVVCDGMGGHSSGREASNLAIATIVREVSAAPAANNPGEVLRNSIVGAGRQVFSLGGIDNNPSRPGSTCVALLIHPGGTEVAHIGDSRAYLLRKGQLWPLTRDHSMVQQMVDAGLLRPEEASAHPDSNKITRALGMRPDSDVELRIEPMIQEARDLFLLITDGVSDVVPDTDLQAMASVAAETGNVEPFCEQVIALSRPRSCSIRGSTKRRFAPARPHRRRSISRARPGSLSKPSARRCRPSRRSRWRPPSRPGRSAPCRSRPCRPPSARRPPRSPKRRRHSVRPARAARAEPSPSRSRPPPVCPPPASLLPARPRWASPARPRASPRDTAPARRQRCPRPRRRRYLRRWPQHPQPRRGAGVGSYSASGSSCSALRSWPASRGSSRTKTKSRPPCLKRPPPPTARRRPNLRPPPRRQQRRPCPARPWCVRPAATPASSLRRRARPWRRLRSRRPRRSCPRHRRRTRSCPPRRPPCRRPRRARSCRCRHRLG